MCLNKDMITCKHISNRKGDSSSFSGEDDSSSSSSELEDGQTTPPTNARPPEWGISSVTYVNPWTF